MALTANSMNGFLQVYAQTSLAQLIANGPIFSQLTSDFSGDAVTGGTAIITRIPTTVWGSPNDLSTNGYASTAASSSAVTITLQERGYDVPFSELEVNTINQNMLTNTYLPSMAKQLANGITVDALNVITSSLFTSTVTAPSSSFFSVLGATGSLQAASTLLTKNEVPQHDRFAYLAPDAYSAAVGGITSTYVYGSSDALRNYNGLKLIDFEPVFQYPRFNGATTPQGGSKYGNSDKLIGIAGQKSGIVAAMRAPVDINYGGLVQSATATDEATGISVQVRWIYDVSKPCYRLAVVAVYGVAAGNPKAIVPILTLSN